ncbi:hypothetical protein [Amycolatopsis sp. YIM 10]|uniref:hypothetical protein n=1 Tax=Amycolatopsis sp. YIM 10 TaxID=2653857 RepID=UPI001290125B|nr:hypothetical protein [Amycolatopsis sp. YIM 10]QFU94277.1 hypothetical protein YIM_45735 [Amycolatopsis sp. YIM 10]
MAFNVTWHPGPKAVAGMHQLGSARELAALVIYLDPDSLVIMPPADPAEWPRFISLLHQIRDGVAELADHLDRTGAPGPDGE